MRADGRGCRAIRPKYSLSRLDGLAPFIRVTSHDDVKEGQIHDEKVRFVSAYFVSRISCCKVEEKFTREDYKEAFRHVEKVYTVVLTDKTVCLVHPESNHVIEGILYPIDEPDPISELVEELRYNPLIGRKAREAVESYEKSKKV